MSIESVSPLPLNVFGTWVTLLDPSDVPAGMSPRLGDVEFFPGGVRTRPGLVSQFSVLIGPPQINGVKNLRDDQPDTAISRSGFTRRPVQRIDARRADARGFRRDSERLDGFRHTVRTRIYGVLRRADGTGLAAALR
jgi:hypothetical protein